jgi:hypothetical protein
MMNKATRIRDVAEICALDCHLLARGTGTEQMRLLSARVLRRTLTKGLRPPL